MKKILALLLAALLALGATACGGGGDTDGDTETLTIKVGASPAPHAEILEKAKEDVYKRQLDRSIWNDAAVVPAFFFIVIHYKHMIRKNCAERKIFWIGLFFRIGIFSYAKIIFHF